MADHEALEHSVEVELVLGIAEALRAEFADGIDSHPGGRGSESGSVNRAFRVAARSILKRIVPVGEELDGVLTWVLRRAAFERLAEVGFESEVSAGLLDSEAVLGDAWLAYLALAPESVARDLSREGMPEGRGDE